MPSGRNGTERLRTSGDDFVWIFLGAAGPRAECLHTFAERTFNTNFSIALANPSSSFEVVT